MPERHTKNYGNIFLVLSIFLGALLLRLLLVDVEVHVDLLSIAGWGQWIYEHGPRGFYSNSTWTYSWPTQPPLVNLFYGLNFFIYSQLVWLFTNLGVLIATLHLIPSKMIWWFNFIKWFESASYPDTYFKYGLFSTVKFFAISADLAIAGAAYLFAKKHGVPSAWIYPALFLFLPFSWYISSLWGQYDQLSFIFLLLSFIFIPTRLFILTPALLVLSIGLKPTVLIFAPLYTWLFYREDKKVEQKLVGLVAAAAVFFFSAAPFSEKNILEFTRHDLIPKIFGKSELRVGSSAFNLWRVLVGDRLLNQDYLFLFVPAKIWGYLAFIAANIIAFILSTRRAAGGVFGAMFIVGMASWLFMTNMMERYAFAGMASGLLMVIYNKKLLKYWLLLALLFSLNLYDSWRFPSQLEFLHQALVWQDRLLTRILSFVNVALFLRMLWLLRREWSGKMYLS